MLVTAKMQTTHFWKGGKNPEDIMSRYNKSKLVITCVRRLL